MTISFNSFSPKFANWISCHLHCIAQLWGIVSSQLRSETGQTTRIAGLDRAKIYGTLPGWDDLLGEKQWLYRVRRSKEGKSGSIEKIWIVFKPPKHAASAGELKGNEMYGWENLSRISKNTIFLFESERGMIYWSGAVKRKVVTSAAWNESGHRFGAKRIADV